MSRPSAPTATAARESGRTLWRLPVPWRGSTKIGRWLRFFTAGNYGQIQRVAGKVGEGSNAALAQHHVVISLGQDVLGGHEEFVERGGHAALRRMGFLARPARLSREKFCMLRAPIWITSAYSSTRSSDSLSIASVTIPNP